MSAFQINDTVSFRINTPDGPLSGSGRVIKIFPAGKSFWLHVHQEDGTVRMLYEATSRIKRLTLESA